MGEEVMYHEKDTKDISLDRVSAGADVVLKAVFASLAILWFACWPIAIFATGAFKFFAVMYLIVATCFAFILCCMFVFALFSAKEKLQEQRLGKYIREWEPAELAALKFLDNLGSKKTQ